MGDTDPVAALVDPAPTATEAPAATEPTSTETPAQAAEPQKPEAPAPKAEPDLDTLLSDEEFVNKLLSHKKAQERIKSVREADIDRRSQERAAEIVRQERARIDAEATERLRKADEARKDDELWNEITKRLEDDPSDALARRIQPELQARRAARYAEAAQAAALERLIPDVMPKLQERAMTEAGRYWMTVLDSYVAQSEGLSDQQRQEFNPRSEKWATALDLLKAVNEASARALADAEIKKRLPVEVEAEITKRTAGKRAEETSPVVLPPGNGADSDEVFLGAYARSESNNTARQIKWMRDNGIL